MAFCQSAFDVFLSIRLECALRNSGCAENKNRLFTLKASWTRQHTQNQYTMFVNCVFHSSLACVPVYRTTLRMTTGVFFFSYGLLLFFSLWKLHRQRVVGYLFIFFVSLFTGPLITTVVYAADSDSFAFVRCLSLESTFAVMMRPLCSTCVI